MTRQRRLATAYSYYGGKGRLWALYPPPKYPLIIEPFAGCAAYAYNYADAHSVHVNDLDPITHDIWQFLTSPTALTYYGLVPTHVTRGDKVSQMFSEPVPVGLVKWCQAEVNFGTQGARGIHDQVTPLGAIYWNKNTKRRLLQAIETCQSWTVTNLDYHDLPDVEATWFVDPPYLNPAGARYRCGPEGIDYAELSNWCRSRKGQVIVCENLGATWLPFTPLTPRRGITSRYQKSQAMEVVWVQG